MLLLILLLVFAAAAAALGPDTAVGSWCARTLTETARQLSAVKTSHVLILVLAVLLFGLMAGALPAEVAWLLSLDLSVFAEIVISGTIAVSLLKARQVRRAVIHQVRGLVARRANRPRTARLRRPRRPAPRADDPSGAWSATAFA